MLDSNYTSTQYKRSYASICTYSIGSLKITPSPHNTNTKHHHPLGHHVHMRVRAGGREKKSHDSIFCILILFFLWCVCEKQKQKPKKLNRILFFYRTQDTPPHKHTIANIHSFFVHIFFFWSFTSVRWRKTLHFFVCVN
jgi:hypothetical protein